jgi:hypothetical protein
VEVRDLNPSLPPCEICTALHPWNSMVLRTGEDDEKTPGQWPSMAGSAVIILHGERLGKRWWVSEERLSVPAPPQPAPGPTLLAFDRGEVPPLPEVQPLGETAADQPTGRFQDEQAELNLEVAGRPPQDDQQETDEGA